MKKIKWTDLITSIVVAELIGVLSSLLAGSYTDVYSRIEQPPFAPPSAVFPVVWAILYAVMGISAYLIYNSEDSGYRSFALKTYIVQLVINFAWSIIFFRFELFTFAAVAAVMLSIAVAAMIWAFLKVRPFAGHINLPYLAWSIFASYLAIGTCILN